MPDRRTVMGAEILALCLVAGLTQFFVNADDLSSPSQDGGCVKVGSQSYKCSFPLMRDLQLDMSMANTTKKLDFSGNNLISIMRNAVACPPLLEQINFKENKLRYLESGIFQKCRSLKKLGMNGNHINHVDEDVFSVLSILEELDLSTNRLTSVPSLFGARNLKKIDFSNNLLVNLRDDAFKENLMISDLLLHGNSLLRLPRRAFPHSDVTSCRKVDLSANRLRATPQVLREMSGLRALRLSGNPIKIFHRSDFTVLDSLNELHLSDVGMEAFPPLTFPFPNLRVLNVANNHLKGESLPNIIFSKLETLHLGGNEIGTLPSNAFIGVQGLIALDLDNCKISSSDFQTFMQVPKLEQLNLQGNRLTGIPPLTKNLKLKSLNLNDNRIGKIDDQDIRFLYKLQQLQMSNNFLSGFAAEHISHIPPSELRVLDISLNKIASLDDIGSNFPHLLSLNVSYNNIKVLPKNQLSGMPNLMELNLRGNHLMVLGERVFDGMYRLERLYLCQNEITLINNTAFDGLSRLEQLTLDDNRLGELTESIFNHTNLKLLSLSNNAIRKIATGMFKCLVDLETLRLRGNRLTEAPDLSSNVRLHGLDLSHNPSIGDLPDRALDGPTSLHQVRLANIGLHRLGSGVFTATGSIRHLDLASSNVLATLPPVVFQCPQLQSLNLTGNPIRSLPVANFSSLPNLQTLEMNNMKVEKFDVEKLFSNLPALRNFSFSNNPLYCGCDMKSFILGEDGSRLGVEVINRENLRCHGPKSLEGKLFDSLRPRDFQQCERSSVLELGVTSARLSLPDVGGLLAEFPDIHNRVWYVPLKGGTEKTIVADHEHREAQLIGLSSDTVYIACVETIKEISSFSMLDQKSGKNQEFCLKFKTSKPKLLSNWSKGSSRNGVFSTPTTSSMSLVFVFSALGVALAIAFLSVASATVTWLKKSGSELQQRLMVTTAEETTSGRSEPPSSILKKRKRRVLEDDVQDLTESGFSVIQLEERIQERAKKKDERKNRERAKVTVAPNGEATVICNDSVTSFNTEANRNLRTKL